MPEGTETPPEGGKTFTQDQLDKIIEDRLTRERQKYADYDDLKKQVADLKKQVADLVAEKKKLEEVDKSDADKVSDQLAALRKQLEEEKAAREKSEGESLRLRVAAAKGLNESQARRLQGSTQEELEADADELIAAFGGKDDKPDPKGGVGRPRETLKPGASNDDDDTEVSQEEANKIAESIASRHSI